MYCMATRSTTGGARRRGVRSSSDERREQVIEAAVKEFAATGFHATSTSTIAKRAGISQPYIYALFPNKHELFLAVNRHVVDRIRTAFMEAARGGADPEERLRLMGHAYTALLERRDEIRFQIQADAAAGDPSLREPIRREFTRLFDDVERMSGAERERVIEFMAKGMLLNVVAALDLPLEYAPTPPSEPVPGTEAPPPTAAPTPPSEPEPSTEAPAPPTDAPTPPTEAPAPPTEAPAPERAATEAPPPERASATEPPRPERASATD